MSLLSRCRKTGITARAATRGGASVFVVVVCIVSTACGRGPHPPQPGDASAPSAEATRADSIVITRQDYPATLMVGQAVTIDNPYGDVQVRFGGFEHKLEAHAVLQEPKGAAHIALAPAASDAGFLIAPRLPANTAVREGQRIDISVFVPEGHALTVLTEQGSIDIRGVHADVSLKSAAGNINLRGIQGAIQAETGEGAIEASLGKAPRNAKQRLATMTGAILVGVDDELDARLEMATSAQFATDYSLQIERLTGQEPNKRARTVIGAPASTLVIESRRGEIRLVRRATFTTAGDASSAPAGQDEGEDNDSD